jgi:hypothetical protein
MRAEPKVADEAAKLLDWGFLAAAGTAGKAGPVGQLVEPVKGVDVLGSTNAPGTGPVPAAAQPADELASGSQTSAGSSVGSSVGGAGPELGRLPAALAGFGLAAAAVLSVRHRPVPRSSSPGRTGSARPARPRPVPARPHPRPLPRSVAERVGSATDRPSRSGVA